VKNMYIRTKKMIRKKYETCIRIITNTAIDWWTDTEYGITITITAPNRVIAY